MTKLLVLSEIVDGSVQVQEADDDDNQVCLSLEQVCFGKHKEFHKGYVVQTEAPRLGSLIYLLMDAILRP